MFRSREWGVSANLQICLCDNILYCPSYLINSARKNDTALTFRLFDRDMIYVHISSIDVMPVPLQDIPCIYLIIWFLRDNHLSG